VIAVTGLSGKEFEEKNDCFKKVQKYFEEVNKSWSPHDDLHISTRSTVPFVSLEISY